MTFFGFSIIQASATNKIPWFILGIISFTIYAINGIVNFSYGLALMIGMFAGGYMGAKTAVKKGNKWVKIVFSMIVIISSIKLIFY